MHNAKLIFWDFDGVIKDSVEVKKNAYITLFEPYGDAVVSLVKEHHDANGGMSRFDKFPIYLKWAGEELLQSRIHDFNSRFSQLVFQAVIDSPWVPGVQDFLRTNLHEQIFVMVSATPQNELEQILRALDLTKCFKAIYGAPTNKKNAIGNAMNAYSINPLQCLMIGDAKVDLNAAIFNKIPFLLRSHDTNSNSFASYSGPFLKDFMAL